MISTDDDPFGILNSGSSGVADDVSEIESLPPAGSKEHRNEIRYKASWRIAVSIGDQYLHDGRIKDISMHGAAILNGRNLKPGTSVTLHIHIPPLTRSSAPKTVIVHSKTCYAIHDSNNQCFRLGITFVTFAQESDRAYMEDRLTNHHVKSP